jgi:hypothetical protein
MPPEASWIQSSRSRILMAESADTSVRTTLPSTNWTTG